MIRYFQVALVEKANVQSLHFAENMPNISYNFHVLAPRFHDWLHCMFLDYPRIHHFPKNKLGIYPKKYLLPFPPMYNNHSIYTYVAFSLDFTHKITLHAYNFLIIANIFCSILFVVFISLA